ncbi:hypothetical protein ElyMa_004397000 [Elysia marginata]|uniref:CTNNB1 binding N-teminal domain-containing protein n=1 Tax=Elysia marginata TaxID=1093978 RepID=A0AAV4H9U3_9GAST|nr:hypothetical protein ElyMa_004397000 [Elysia marginata]
MTGNSASILILVVRKLLIMNNNVDDYDNVGNDDDEEEEDVGSVQECLLQAYGTNKQRVITAAASPSPPPLPPATLGTRQHQIHHDTTRLQHGHQPAHTQDWGQIQEGILMGELLPASSATTSL